MLRLVSRFSLVAAAALLAAGCGQSGPSLYKCTGTVKYNGNPVEGATVAFTSPEGKATVASTDAQGNFTIEAAAGTNQVAISKTSTAGGAGMMMGGGPMITDPEQSKTMTPEQQQEHMQKMQERLKGMEGQNQTAPAGPQQQLPARYASGRTSGLTAEVTTDPAKNTFTFDLTD